MCVFMEKELTPYTVLTVLQIAVTICCMKISLLFYTSSVLIKIMILTCCSFTFMLMMLIY